MAQKSDFTGEEWQQIIIAPQMALLVISISSPSGPIGLVSEVVSVSKMVVETMKASTGNALIDAVAADYQERAQNRQKIEMPELSRNPVDLKTQCIQALRDLAALLSQKAPDEADGYMRWVYRAAQGSAEAAKEGGFLGIGGKRVSEEESAALDEIAAALGIAV